MVDESKITKFHTKLIKFLVEEAKSMCAESTNEQFFIKDIHVEYDKTKIIFSDVEQPYLDLSLTFKNDWEK